MYLNYKSNLVTHLFLNRFSMVYSLKLTKQQWTCCTELSLMWLMGTITYLLYLFKFKFNDSFFTILRDFWSLSRYPNLKSVRELIYKRGYGKLNKQRIALTDNSIIEQVHYFILLLLLLLSQFEFLHRMLLTWLNDTLGTRQARSHIHWRSYPWDHNCRTPF